MRDWLALGLFVLLRLAGQIGEVDRRPVGPGQLNRAHVEDRPPRKAKRLDIAFLSHRDKDVLQIFDILREAVTVLLPKLAPAIRVVGLASLRVHSTPCQRSGYEAP